MSKDFKKQAAPASNFGQYGLGWMLRGIAIGLMVGLGMYALANNNNLSANAGVASPQQQVAGATPSTPGVTTLAANVSNADTANGVGSGVVADSPAGLSEGPAFSYHAVLPQLEVGIPVSVQTGQIKPAKEPVKKPVATEDKKTNTPEETSTTPAKPAASKPLTGMNGFQIGSYKTLEQASAMQNRLKRNGMTTRVEKASINGDTWFRVRVGPADSTELMSQWEQTLSGMGISPLPVRM